MITKYRILWRYADLQWYDVEVLVAIEDVLQLNLSSV
jgi:hypothetical protein